MTKAELLSAVSAKVADLTKKQTADVVDAVFDALTDAIVTSENNRFSYPGFGTFTVKERKERPGHNPRTREPIVIKATKSISFKAAPKLKAVINGEDPDAVQEVKADKKEEKSAKKCDKKCSKKSK